MFRDEVEKAKLIVQEEIESVRVEDCDNIHEYLQARHRAVQKAVKRLGYDDSHSEYHGWLQFFHKGVLPTEVVIKGKKTNIFW